MRCAIVMASALTKARRWDAAHFLGDVETLRGDQVAKAERAVKDAESRLGTAKRKQADEQARVQAMHESGAVTPITSSPPGDQP
jgi:hypothetical protein